MLKKMFAKQVIETPCIPAEEGQSPYIISYKAVRHWWGEWSVYHCNYLPAARVAQLLPQSRKAFGPEIFTLQKADGTTDEYRCAAVLHSEGWREKAVKDFIARRAADCQGKTTYAKKSSAPKI